MKYISNKSDSLNTIFFIHGNSFSSKAFEPTITSRNTEYRLIAFDLLGNGEAAKTGNTDDYSIKNRIDSCVKFINSFDGEKILAGHSYGGHVAIEIAEQITNLKGLAIFGAPPVKNPLNLAEAFGAYPGMGLFFEPNPKKDDLIDVMNDLSLDKSTHNLIIDSFYDTDPVSRNAIAKGIESDSFQNEYEILKNLDIKKLIINGDQDPLMNKEYLEMVAKETQTDLISIENCAHYISLEKPEIFNKTIFDFAEKSFSS